MEKEKIDIDSWYTPKEKKNVTVLNLTDEEEDVTEEDVCDMCESTGEVSTFYCGEDTGYNSIIDGTRPCICQTGTLDDNEDRDSDR